MPVSKVRSKPAGVSRSYNPSPVKMPKAGGRNGKGRRKVLKIAKGVNKFLRDIKVVSKLANVADEFGVPYAGKVGKVAGAIGYGKKPRKKKAIKCYCKK